MYQDKSDQQIKRLQQVRNRVRQEHLQPILKTKSQTDDQFILSSLKNHFVFYNLSQSQLNNVRQYMWFCQIQQQTSVFRQGQTGSCFFIVASGSVDVIVDNKIIKTLKPGQGFGQLALLYQIQRPSTILTRQDTTFWVIQRQSFRQAVQQIVICQFQQNQKYLQGVAFYQFLDNRIKQKVAASFVLLKYFKGQNIIQQGDPGSAFYIIKSGTASLIQGSIQQRKIFKGQSFGINSLYYNTMRKMTVRAQQQVTCQVLGRQTLAKIIGVQNYRQVMFRNYVKYTLQKNKQLFSLIRNQQNTFFQGMKTKYYKTNQIVFKKGSIVTKLIIIIQGRIKKFRSANFLAQAGQIWGQNYIKSNINDIRLDDDIVVQTQSVLIQLNIQSIRNAMTNLQLIQRIQPKKQANKCIFDVKKINYICQIADSALCSYHYLIQNNKEQKKQDIKLIGKIFKLNQIQKQNAGVILHQHLKVLQQSQHAFLPKFYQSIQRGNNLLVISQYIQGQSLYDVIRQIGLLSTLDCQFYVSSMILLLQYFLSQQIVIRDLKPDNFIVDQKGYLYLVSLGSSKYIGQMHRTSTVIGTPHYMAPQVVLGKQYNQMIDLWAVGIMLYQFLVGQLPFGAMTQNPYQIYQQIIQGDPSFPRGFKDRRAKKIIQMMLSLNPQSRHNGSYTSLKNNSWFQNIKWDDLLDKNVYTPYKPINLNKFPNNNNNGIPLNEFLDSLANF